MGNGVYGVDGWGVVDGAGVLERHIETSECDQHDNRQSIAACDWLVPSIFECFLLLQTADAIKI